MKMLRVRNRLIACGFLFLPCAAFADAVLDWNEVALAGVIAARQPPPDGARTMTMVHIGMFDAVNAVEQRYTPYAFKGRAPGGVSDADAAVAAAHNILVKLFPDLAEPVEADY